MKKELVLILGGARSGKSSFAQTLATGYGSEVLYVATAAAGDEEMRRRIENHRKSRPSDWRTLEEPLALANSIDSNIGATKVVILDCLTVWLSNFLAAKGTDEDDPGAGSTSVEQGALAEIGSLLDCWAKSTASLILVSNEVGMGLVPPYPLGRFYRDLLGKVNQLVASRASRVYVLFAGIPIDLKMLNMRQGDPN